MTNIEQQIDGYFSSQEDDRKARRKKTQEFYTPYSLVKQMCDKIDEAAWSDKEKTFLEPSFGNGNFLLYIIYNRIQHNVDWRTTLSTTYGVELLASNVIETHNRIMQLLTDMGISFDRAEAKRIMNHNLVCSDFFKWDFENWKPMIEDTQLSLF